MEIVEADLAGQPFGEVFESQRAVRREQRLPLLVGDDDQRMRFDAAQAAVGDQGFGVAVRDDAVGDQQLEHLGQRQAMLLNGIDRLVGHEGIPGG